MLNRGAHCFRRIICATWECSKTVSLFEEIVITSKWRTSVENKLKDAHRRQQLIPRGDGLLTIEHKSQHALNGLLNIKCFQFASSATTWRTGGTLSQLIKTSSSVFCRLAPKWRSAQLQLDTNWCRDNFFLFILSQSLSILHDRPSSLFKSCAYECAEKFVLTPSVLINRQCCHLYNQA